MCNSTSNQHNSSCPSKKLDRSPPTRQSKRQASDYGFLSKDSSTKLNHPDRCQDFSSFPSNAMPGSCPSSLARARNKLVAQQASSCRSPLTATLQLLRAYLDEQHLVVGSQLLQRGFCAHASLPVQDTEQR